MNATSKLIVSNCHPTKDLPQVIENLRHTGLYVEGQDSEDTLREFLRVIPSSILVVKEKGKKTVLGSVYLPFSQIPIIARVAINPVIKNTKARNEIKRLLYNHCFTILRQRHPHMPHVEELYDWNSPRKAPSQIKELKEFGFDYGWDLFSVTHRLRDERGDPTPDIPSFLSMLTGPASVEAGVTLPEPISLLQRHPDIPIQEQFSVRVKDILHAPIRAELDTGVFVAYLQNLNQQKGFSHDKLGLILLINDHAGDQENHAILSQNRLVLNYVTALSKGEHGLQDIEALDIPPEYKIVAKEVIRRDFLEIRFDYLHSKLSRPHFGYLREHLFKLLTTFKNSEVTDVKTYASDVDSRYSPHHFESIKKTPSLMNFSRQDFLPAPEVHEGAKEVDISRDILIHFDEFRFWHYSHSLMKILQGTYPTTTPVIAADLRAFATNGVLDSEFIEMLQRSPYDEDWNIGDYLRKKVIVTNDAVSTFAAHTTQIGEVSNPLRARTSRAPLTPRSEAELLFNIIAKKIYTGTGYTITNYDFLQNPKAHVDTYEHAMRATHTIESDNSGHTSHFAKSPEFEAMLQHEQRVEYTKVENREQLFKKYFSFLVKKSPRPSKEEMQQIIPYIEHFSDELNMIKTQLDNGISVDQIFTYCKQKASTLLDPDAPIHAEIARLRALNTYAIRHDIDLSKSVKQQRLSQDEYRRILASLEP